MITNFEGTSILCFYPSGLFQGHFIDKHTNKSPFSLAGKHLPDYVDPQHNDCMEPDDFYQVLIQAHDSLDKITLVLRRPKENDAGGLFTHEHEKEQNDGYEFLFETNHFLNGQQALAMKNKYFSASTVDEDVIVCIGDVKLDKVEEA